MHTVLFSAMFFNVFRIVWVPLGRPFFSNRLMRLCSAGRRGILKRYVWIREDVASRPYHWLPPEFVPPLPVLICDPSVTSNASRILVEAALLDAQFRKFWLPFFMERGETSSHSGCVGSMGSFLYHVESHDVPKKEKTVCSW